MDIDRNNLKQRIPIEKALLFNAINASGSGHQLDSILAGAINTSNSDIYGRAIDSVYNSSHIGGSQLHHLFDGQHDLVGAFEAARNASPTDSVGAELFGTAQHLSKDAFSVMGLPIMSINPETYRASADWIQSHLGISKSWQADFMQFNGMELLGGGIASAAVILGITNKDTGVLAEIAGSTGLAGALAANPIAMLAAATALVAAWKIKQDGASWSPEIRRVGIGLASSATAIGVGSALTGFAATGTLPLIMSLALSLTAGLTVRALLMNRFVIKNRLPLDSNFGIIPANDERLWKKHIGISAIEINSNLDELALNILRRALA